MANKTEAAPEGAIIKDAELKAINGVVKLLTALDREAQKRVLTYVVGRFPEPEAS